MIQVVRLLKGAARVSVLADHDAAFVHLSSGTVRLALHLRADTASALGLELRDQLPTMPTHTCRPAPVNGPSWPLILHRLNRRQLQPADHDALAAMLLRHGVHDP